MVRTEAQILEESQEIVPELQEAADDVRQRIKEVYDAPNRAEDASVLERLAQIKESHGFHAYRYEIMHDGSVIAVWANEPDGDIHLKAFNDMQEASAWSPRDER